MKKSFISIIGIAFTILMLSGCSTKRAVHYTNIPIHSVSADKPTLAQIGKAIERGATSRRWKVASSNKGEVIVTIHRNGMHSKYRIAVAVNFTQNSYSIRHKNSTPNLNYDGVNAHKKYNREVNVLKTSIDYELQTMSIHPMKSEIIPQKPIQQKSERTVEEKLRTLKGLHTDGIITDKEYNTKRNKLIEEL